MSVSKINLEQLTAKEVSELNVDFLAVDVKNDLNWLIITSLNNVIYPESSHHQRCYSVSLPKLQVNGSAWMSTLFIRYSRQVELSAILNIAHFVIF